MSKHTPVSWYCQGEINTEFGRPPVRRFELYRVDGPFGHPATCAKEEDAEFIVRAANAHYALVEALELGPDTLHREDEQGPCLCRQCEFVRARRAALKFAKEGA